MFLGGAMSGTYRILGWWVLGIVVTGQQYMVIVGMQEGKRVQKQEEERESEERVWVLWFWTQRFGRQEIWTEEN